MPTTAPADGGEGFKQCTLPPSAQYLHTYMLIYPYVRIVADRLEQFSLPPPPRPARLALGSRQRHAARLHTAIPSILLLPGGA